MSISVKQSAQLPAPVHTHAKREHLGTHVLRGRLFCKEQYLTVAEPLIEMADTRFGLPYHRLRLLPLGPELCTLETY